MSGKVYRLIALMLVVVVMCGAVFASDLTRRDKEHLIMFSDYILDNPHSIYWDGLKVSYSGTDEVLKNLALLPDMISEDIEGSGKTTVELISVMRKSMESGDRNFNKTLSIFESGYEPGVKSAYQFGKSLFDSSMKAYVETLNYGKNVAEKKSFYSGLLSYLSSKGKDVLLDKTKMTLLSKKANSGNYTTEELNYLIRKYSILFDTAKNLVDNGKTAYKLKAPTKRVSTVTGKSVDILLDSFSEMLLEEVSFAMKDVRILGNSKLPYLKNRFTIKSNKTEPLYLLGKGDTLIQDNPLLIYYSEDKNIAKVIYELKDGVYQPSIKATGKKGSSTKIRVFMFGNYDEYVINVIVK